MSRAPNLKLGYVVIESEKIDDWETFSRDGLGLHADRLAPDLLVLRVDDRERRIVIRRGPSEDVTAVGWETDDTSGLAAMRTHLEANVVAPVDGSSTEAAFRGVDRFFGVEGHKGLRFEFFANAQRTNKPLAAKTRGFVTGAGGLGHVVLFTRKPEALIEELERLLGARLSDTITDQLQGMEMEFAFFHLNERHHSLAVAATKGLRIDPIRTRVQHLMFEAASLEDVGDAYLRCKALGYKIAMGIGQHPNDLGVSFYVISPSGFEVELGHAPRTIGEDWAVGEYRGISKWGHKPEFEQRPSDQLSSAWMALTSLFRKT
jgi:2,3-dihydroxybiphenyl 1,2-dioxygenase